MQDVTATLSQAETELRRQIGEVSAAVAARPAPSAEPAQAGATTPTQPGPAGAPSPGPGQRGQPKKPGADGDDTDDGSRFISCVNGKALYRDKDNTLFQVSGIGPSGVDRCAR